MADGTITQVQLSDNKIYNIEMYGLNFSPDEINQTLNDVQDFFADNALNRETLDTLKEVQDWIDEDGAAAQALAIEVSNKVNRSGDTMTGALHIQASNPHIHFKDTEYSTDWYIQAYQDQFGFGPSWVNAVKSDVSGNMTVPGTVQGKLFKTDATDAAIKPSDSNEISFGSNANYIYIGYDNRIGSAGAVDTYKFGTHSGVAGATNGNIECGSVSAGRTVTVANKVTLQYNSANECLDFIFT